MNTFLTKWASAIIIGLLMLLIAAVLYLILSRPKNADKNLYKQNQQVLERERDAIAKERDAYKDQLASQEKELKALSKVDSLLRVSINNATKQYNDLSKQREAVNSRIDKFSSDDLKRFFSELK